MLYYYILVDGVVQCCNVNAITEYDVPLDMNYDNNRTEESTAIALNIPCLDLYI